MTDDLRARLVLAGYTPGKRDVAPLVELALGAEQREAELAERALVRVPELATPVVIARLPGLADAQAVRAVHALGGLARAGAGEARTALVAMLGDAAAPVRVRREATIALGKLRGDDVAAALVARWDSACEAAGRAVPMTGGPGLRPGAAGLAPEERRALVDALGKVGGEAALARVGALDPGDDRELARLRDRAVLMIERSAGREAASAIELDAAPPAPVALVARCRAGLEDLLAAELATAGLATRRRAPGELVGTLVGPLRPITAARTLLDVGIELELSGAGGGDLASAIAATLTRADVRALLAALTAGPVRWRLDFASGGHRRGVVWRAAQAVRARDPSLINDPTATTWDVVVGAGDLAGTRTLELVPRRRADDRFAYRVRDVPAASHPTIAAALARIAGAEPGDRVWDPFVGSAAELIERRLLGPARLLVGSDLDAGALAAARANLAAARVDAALVRADARAAPIRDVDLVITNPPLGRRLRGDAAGLLATALPGLAAALVPGGRLVWVSPAVKRTERAARAAGLVLDHRRDVDLGGFTAAVERWIRPR